MTTLALAVDADDELWTLDELPTPEAPYVEVGSELVEVRSRFPSQTYTLTGETLPPKIRVRRGIAGTAKASHIQGSTLTPNYGLGSGGGGGAIAVTGTVSGEVPAATGLVLPGIVTEDAGVAVYQPGIYVQTTDPGAVGEGAIWKDITGGYGNGAVWWERDAIDVEWKAWFIPRAVAVGDEDAFAGPIAETSGYGKAEVKSIATASGAGIARGGSQASSVDGDAQAVSQADSSGDGNASVYANANALGGGSAYANAEAIAVTGTAVAGSMAIRGAASAGMSAEVDGTSARMAFNGTTPIVKPIVPLTTPDAQDVIDALVALGLITQSD